MPKLTAGLLALTASLLLTGDATGIPARLTFSGELQRVTDRSISIRLSDGRIIEARNTATHGDWSPRTLVQRYTVGDRVEITCRPTPGEYYQPVGHRLVLDLTKLQFLRNPSKEERARALLSKAWRQPPNLLRVDPESQPVPIASLPDEALAAAADPAWLPKLQQIRSRILAFVSALPNFVADEVAQRFVSRTNPPNWQLIDTIESEINIKGGAAYRANIMVSGKPWNLPYRELPGFVWTDAFGSQLAYLFSQNCPTTFAPEGQVSEDGKSLSVIRYNSPPDACDFYWNGYQQFYPAKSGRILLDENEQNVMRLETTSDAFPAAFPISSVEKKVSWDFVTIGDATHLLPVSAEIKVVLSSGEMRLAKHEYKNHRHFEAASNITYH